MKYLILSLENQQYDCYYNFANSYYSNYLIFYYYYNFSIDFDIKSLVAANYFFIIIDYNFAAVITILDLYYVYKLITIVH